MANGYTLVQREVILDNMFPNGHSRVTAKMKQWLYDIGYFFAPTNEDCRLCYNGGLFDHDYDTATTLSLITQKLNLTWQDPESPLIIGMFHDLWKAKAFLDKDTMQMPTASTTAFERDPDTPYNPNGQRSVALLATQLVLTEEEVACITYMENYSMYVDPYINSKAAKQFPNLVFASAANCYAADVLESQQKGEPHD